ncbi:MAG: hypothetical protein RL701_6834 [Pseudomonadota bacterium]|jgi:thioredoxin 1
MPIARAYPDDEPTRAEVDALSGLVVVEFGAPWCGICKAAQPNIEAALRGHEEVQHIKVHDAQGKPLGRSFKVKLWPTLIALRDGQEVARVVRPERREQISQLLAAKSV